MAKRQPVTAIPKLTVEELCFAMASGGAVYDGKMQQAPLSELSRPVQIEGQVLTLTDIPINRAAMAILESLKHDPEKARAALHRIMMIAFGVMNHPEAKNWTQPADDGQLRISIALLEAIATIPASADRKVNPKLVFRLARKIAKGGGR